MSRLDHTNPAPSTTRDTGLRFAGAGAGLRVDGVSVIRGERLVLHAVSFSMAPGGAVLVTGPNGAGKTTLLRAVAGLLRPDAGQVLWDGAEGGAAGWLGPLDGVKPGLTAAENLHLAARLSGGSAPAALASMGLDGLASVPARLLSTGQRRRLAIARLSLSAAPLWLLDEPTLGLDAASVVRLGAVLAAHRARGGVVVAATHADLPLPGAGAVALDAPA